MTENIEKNDVSRFFEIMDELFQGRDAALVKYAKVRHTLYEMNYYRRGYSLSEVNPAAKVYFAKRFLPQGVTIRTATEQQLEEAYDRLEHAVKDGCHGRCIRLVEEMNLILKKNNLEPLNNPDKFLAYFSFNYKQREDEFGNPAFEPGRGDPILDFRDKDNRTEFYSVVKFLEKQKIMLSPIEIGKIVVKLRKGVRGD